MGVWESSPGPAAGAPPDPLAWFQAAFRRAQEAGEPDATAHVLATAAGGQPGARVVLLKGVDAAGFLFFTNYTSRKGRDLTENPRAALLFFWPRIRVEIHVQGVVDRLGAAESDAYFASRPRGSRLGAWASRQTRRLAWHGWLIVRWLAFAARFFGRAVPRPPFWGGFRLTPNALEFLERDERGWIRRTTCERTATGWRQETSFEIP